jgi:hypothetical protein
VFNYSLSEENEDLLDEVEDQIDASFENFASSSARNDFLQSARIDFFDSQNSISPRRSSFSERLRTTSFSERLRGASFSMETPTPNYRSRANSISRANSLCRTSSMDNRADDLLTPLRNRIERQLAEQKMKKNLNLSAGDTILPVSPSSHFLSSTVTQSIRDLQILIANNICNAIFCGRPILRGIDLSPTKNYAELFTSHLGWEEFLEVSFLHLLFIVNRRTD